MKQPVLGVDADKSVPHSRDLPAEILSAEIGQFLPLDIAPYTFYRVQLRRIGGETHYGQPFALTIEIGCHLSAAMRRQSVPKQDQSLVMELFSKLDKEIDQLHLVVAVGDDAKEQPTPCSVPAISDHRADR